MATYFVENLSHPVAHGTDYPGTRIDADNELNAANSFRASTGAAISDKLRVILDGPNYVMFFQVNAGTPTAVPAAKPVLPPVGS